MQQYSSFTSHITNNTIPTPTETSSKVKNPDRYHTTLPI